MKTKLPLLAKLDPRIPMVYDENGLRLVFREPLTARQSNRVFDLFPLVTTIESPRCTVSRIDSSHLHPDCPAAGMYRAIQAAAKLNQYP